VKNVPETDRAVTDKGTAESLRRFAVGRVALRQNGAEGGPACPAHRSTALLDVDAVSGWAALVGLQPAVDIRCTCRAAAAGLGPGVLKLLVVVVAALPVAAARAVGSSGKYSLVRRWGRHWMRCLSLNTSRQMIQLRP